MKLFNRKKKKIDLSPETKKELKKIPRIERKFALKLLKNYEDGNILKIENLGE